MRLIFEHPWSVSISIAIIGSGFAYVGTREGLQRRIVIGLVLWFVAITTFTLGVLVDTPTEFARRVVYSFVKAVEIGDITASLELLDDEVILVDNWSGTPLSGSRFVCENITELHRRHTLKHNTILRCEIFERKGDVLVEISLLCRVSGIGTVPSRWRLLVKGAEHSDWRIYSIDAIEIAGRAYR